MFAISSSISKPRSANALTAIPSRSRKMPSIMCTGRFFLVTKRISLPEALTRGRFLRPGRKRDVAHGRFSTYSNRTFDLLPNGVVADPV